MKNATLGSDNIDLSAKDILVIGATGQVARSLQKIAPHLEYWDRSKAELTQLSQLEQSLKNRKPKTILNLAAFTQVDKAETEQSTALLVNAEANRVLARNCSRFISLSTDYVFSGDKSTPYTETDSTSPLNYYGYTKLQGEQLALETNPNSIILRTSWVISEYGVNFVKRMIELSQTRDELNVVFDQIGSPTYAGDLAHVLLEILRRENNFASGIYNFTNEGVCSWYDLAITAFKFKQIKTKVFPIRSSEYPTPTKRPAYSVLDKTKIKKALQITIPHWQESLQVCLGNLK